MIQGTLMPPELTTGERLAYRQGYDKRATRYAREVGTAPVEPAAAATFYRDREAVLHKAGMAAVTGLRRRRGGAS